MIAIDTDGLCYGILGGVISGPSDLLGVIGLVAVCGGSSFVSGIGIGFSKGLVELADRTGTVVRFRLVMTIGLDWRRRVYTILFWWVDCFVSCIGKGLWREVSSLPFLGVCRFWIKRHF